MKKNLGKMLQMFFLVLFTVLMVKGNMGIWLGILGISVFLSIFFGRFYCGYICPMSPVMNWAEKLSWKMGIQRKESPPWVRGGYLGWVMLLAMIGIMLLGKKILAVNIPVILLVLLGAALWALFYEKSLFHRYLCPYSGFLDRAGSKAIWSKTVEEALCNGCGRCLQVCPSEAIRIQQKTKKAYIEAEFCHQCQECSATCPQEAILYKREKS